MGRNADKLDLYEFLLQSFLLPVTGGTCIAIAPQDDAGRGDAGRQTCRHYTGCWEDYEATGRETKT